MHKHNKIQTKIIVGCFFILCAGVLVGCQGKVESPIQVVETPLDPVETLADPSQPVSPGVTAEVQVSPTSIPEEPTPDPAAIQVAWQSSPHAASYVIDASGQNNTCARCHSPINWMPTMDDLPESCFTCKFELEIPPATISQVDWTNIPCKICHKVDKKGVVEAEYSWLSIAPLDEYTKVASPTELCMNCHATENIPGHGTVQLVAAHAGYECTQCHPAHEATTTCDVKGCHPALDNASAPIPGHDPDHASVSCIACHDGSGLEVGPDEASGLWTTFIPATADGSINRFKFSSHNVVLEAACNRCHFTNNPWGLSSPVDE